MSFPIDDVTVFCPSTFYVVVSTRYGLLLEIQLNPIMQVYIKAEGSMRGKLRGASYFLSGPHRSLLFDPT